MVLFNVGLTLKMSLKLQLAQNAAAHLPKNASRSGHSTPVLQEIHWYPIPFSVPNSGLLVIIYKILYGRGPEYLNDHVFHHETVQPLTSTVKVPPHSVVLLAFTRKTAFSIVELHLWNCLFRKAHLTTSQE